MTPSTPARTSDRASIPTPEQNILSLLLRHIVGAQFTGTVYGTEVTNIQAAILGELVRRQSGGRSPSLEELGKVVGIHPSTVSRVLQQLTKIGFLASTRNEDDHRRTDYRCTAKGNSFVSLMWERVEGIISQRVTRFSSSERLELENFLEVFAGNNAMSSLMSLPHDSRLGLIWKALTYSHGVAAGDFVGSGYSPTDWITLSEIHYRSRSPSELSTLMRAPRSTVSLRLKKLLTSGLITTEKGSIDKRERVLSLTKKGKDALSHIEKTAQILFRNSLKSLPRQQISRGIELLTKYVEALHISTTTPSLRCIHVPTSELELLRARCWSLLVVSSSSSAHYPVCEYFFHHAHSVVTVSEVGGFEAAIELARIDRRSLRVINAVILRSSPSSIVLEDLASVLGKVMNRTIIFQPELARYLRQCGVGSHNF